MIWGIMPKARQCRRCRGDLRGSATAEHAVRVRESEAQQASAAVFRARDLLVRQRTQLINAVREGATAQMIEGEYGTTVGETGSEEPGLSIVPRSTLG